MCKREGPIGGEGKHRAGEQRGAGEPQKRSGRRGVPEGAPGVSVGPASGGYTDRRAAPAPPPLTGRGRGALGFPVREGRFQRGDGSHWAESAPLPEGCSRTGKEGSAPTVRWGAPPPSQLPSSCHRQRDCPGFMGPPGPAGSWPLPDPRPGPTGGGREQVGVQPRRSPPWLQACPRDSRVSRVPTSDSGPASGAGFSKGSLRFSFFRPSLFPSHRDKETLVKGRL